MAPFRLRRPARRDRGPTLMAYILRWVAIAVVVGMALGVGISLL